MIAIRRRRPAVSAPGGMRSTHSIRPSGWTEVGTGNGVQVHLVSKEQVYSVSAEAVERWRGCLQEVLYRLIQGFPYSPFLRFYVTEESEENRRTQGQE